MQEAAAARQQAAEELYRVRTAHEAQVASLYKQVAQLEHDVQRQQQVRRP